MVNGMKVITACLVAAAFLLGVPLRGSADDAAVKKDNKAAEKKQKKKDDKGKNNDGNARGGINKAFDGFKKESSKGKKNLNDLNERERAKSGK